MAKNIIWLLIVSLFLFSCTDGNMSYREEILNGDDAVIFETYKYKEPIGTIHLYMKTDYALRITPFFRNVFDKWKDKWTIEYIIYDAQNRKKFITNDVLMMNDIIQNEIPQGIRLYEYVIETSWLPNNSYHETIKIIKDICKLNNIEFINTRENPEMGEEDYINTFWCISCMIFMP